MYQSTFDGILKMSLLEVQLGPGLMGFAKSISEHEPSSLALAVQSARKTIASQTGVLLDPVRIRDRIDLPTHQYTFSLDEIEQETGEVRPNHWLLMQRSGGRSLPGPIIREPAYGLAAQWVAVADFDADVAEAFTTSAPSGVISSHLVRFAKDHLSKLLTRSHVIRMVNNCAIDNLELVDEVIPTQINYAQLHEALRRLLDEGLCIRNTRLLLESIHDHSLLSEPPALVPWLLQSLSHEDSFKNRGQ